MEEVALRPMPKGWSFPQASGLFYTAPTAYAALVLRARAKEGDYVLIHGAAGALGLAAVRISKALGLHVIATVNTKEKAEVAKKFGADYAIDSNGEWEKEVPGLTPDKRGVDVVLDPLAGETEKIPTNRYLLKNVSVSGLFWGMYAQMDPEAVVTVWDALLDFVAQGKVKPMMYTDKHFVGVEQTGPALQLLASGEAWGKIVIEIAQETGRSCEVQPHVSRHFV